MIIDSDQDLCTKSAIADLVGCIGVLALQKGIALEDRLAIHLCNADRLAKALMIRMIPSGHRSVH